MLAATVARITVPADFPWTAGDFIAAALLLGVPCLAFELALRASRGNTRYILAAALGLGTAFLTVWIALAVGILGDENGRADGVFVAVLGIAVAGALAARLRPAGLARALLATGIAQAAVAAYAAVLGSPEGTALSLLFAGTWLAAAWLFRGAAADMAATP